MIVNIFKPERHLTSINFKGRDMIYDDLVTIICGMANSYCFEPSGVLSEDFIEWCATVKPNTSYRVLLGYDVECPRQSTIFHVETLRKPRVESKSVWVPTT